MVINSRSIIQKLIIGGSVSGKTNSLPSLIIHPPDINKIYLYTKDRHKVKHHFSINKQSTELNHLNYYIAFTEYPKIMDDIYENIEEYNPNKNEKYWSFLMIWLLICLVFKSLIQ